MLPCVPEMLRLLLSELYFWNIGGGIMNSTKLRLATFRNFLIYALLFLSAVSFSYADDKLIFLTEEWKPFNFKSNDKEVDGFTVEIVEKIAKKLGTNISIEIWPWSRSYITVLDTEKHAIFSIYRTPERETLFKWVGPVYSVDTLLWGLESRKLKINSLEDAKNYQIIVQKDSAYEEALKARGFKNYTLNAIRTDHKMVLLGRGDLVPLSALSIEKLKKSAIEAGMPNEKWKAYAVLYSKPVYIAFNINTPEHIIQSWQAELDKIKNDSFYSDIEAKFITPILNQKR